MTDCGCGGSCGCGGGVSLGDTSQVLEIDTTDAVSAVEALASRIGQLEQAVIAVAQQNLD